MQTPHPAAEIFPLLIGEEFEQFKADIAQRGVLDPIWLHEGLILDGRNRYRACTELGIDCPSREYTGDSPVTFVWSMNSVRRHLTKSQRATLAVEMLPLLEAEAKARQGARHDLENIPPISTGCSGEANDLAGKQVGVGKTMVQKAKQVKKADAELFEEVKRGKVQLQDAHRKIKVGTPIPPKHRNAPRAERARQISQLAATGHRSSQIAEVIGIQEAQVRNIARAAGITLPDAAIGKVHKIDFRRVIENTVYGLEGYALGLQTINGAVTQLDRATAAQWGASLKNSIVPIHRLQKQLREVANGN